MNESAWDNLQKLEAKHPWYLARLKLMLNWSQEIEPGSYGIELGCGSGLAAKALLNSHKDLQILVTDINDEGLNIAKSRGLTTKKMNASIKSSWPNRKFSFAIAMDVIEHIEDDETAIQNLYEHLCKDALVFITVPSFMFLWSNHDIQNQHYRRYSKKGIIQLLERNGIKIEKIRYWNSFFLIPLFLERKLRDKYPMNSGPLEEGNFLPGNILASIMHAVYRIESKFGLVTGMLPGTSLIIQARK